MLKEDCPDIALFNHLGDLTAEQERMLSEHLDRCAKCRERIERAGAGDRTLKAVARNLRGKEDLPVELKRALQKCISDPNILVVGSPHAGTSRDHGEFGASPDRDEATYYSNPLEALPTVSIVVGGWLGRYKIMEQIGRGGMGVVWKAWDPQQKRFVAIKVLDNQALTDPTARKRFVREAKAVAVVDHRNVVKLYAVEESPVPYIVMEFIDGPSLRNHLEKKGALDLPTILRLGLQIAGGLEASHLQGITHRDVKPANIVLDVPTGRAKLTDFGLAQIEGDGRITMVGYVAGTPAYMSPEQARGENVGHRSDLFSLGSVLYAMATGKSPFDDDQTVGDRTATALDRVCSSEPIPPQSLNPEVTPELAELIQRLHSKRSEDRPESAKEVVRILRQQLDQLNQQIEQAVAEEELRRMSDGDIAAVGVQKPECKSNAREVRESLGERDTANQPAISPRRWFKMIAWFITVAAGAAAWAYVSS